MRSKSKRTTPNRITDQLSPGNRLGMTQFSANNLVTIDQLIRREDVCNFWTLLLGKQYILFSLVLDVALSSFSYAMRSSSKDPTKRLLESLCSWVATNINDSVRN